MDPELAKALFTAKNRKFTLIVVGKRGSGKTSFIRETILRLRPESDVYSFEFDRKRRSHALGFATYSAFVRALKTTCFVQVLEATIEDWAPKKLRASALCAPEIAKFAKSSPETFGIVAVQAESESLPPENAHISAIVLREHNSENRNNSCGGWKVQTAGSLGGNSGTVLDQLV